MTLFLYWLLVTTPLDSLVNFLQKNFTCSFTEIVIYKEAEVRDTFKGTLTRKGNVLSMEIRTPQKEKYTIIGDTLLIESNGKKTKEILPDEALKFLSFDFLNDTINYVFEFKDNKFSVKPKDNSNFNYIEVEVSDSKPKRLIIDDDEKTLNFRFYNWK